MLTIPQIQTHYANTATIGGDFQAEISVHRCTMFHSSQGV